MNLRVLFLVPSLSGLLACAAEESEAPQLEEVYYSCASSFAAPGQCDSSVCGGGSCPDLVADCDWNGGTSSLVAFESNGTCRCSYSCEPAGPSDRCEEGAGCGSHGECGIFGICSSTGRCLCSGS